MSTHHPPSFFKKLCVPYLLFFGLLAIVIVVLIVQAVNKDPDEVLRVTEQSYHKELLDLIIQTMEQHQYDIDQFDPQNFLKLESDQIDFFTRQAVQRWQKEPEYSPIETNLTSILQHNRSFFVRVPFSFLETYQDNLLLRTVYEVDEENWLIVSTLLQDDLNQWREQHPSAEFAIDAPSGVSLYITSRFEEMRQSDAYQFSAEPITPSLSQYLGTLQLVLPIPHLSPIQLALPVLLTLFLLPLALFIGYEWARKVAQPLEQVIETTYQLLSLDATYQPMTPLQIEVRLNHLRQKLDQANRLRRLLSRYVGHNIATQILDGQQQLGGRAVWATVFFADIRDFTALTETSDIIDLFNELNDYFTILQKVIEEHGGVINKFGGDSVLALFGVPQPLRHHAMLAVRAACEVMDELAALNQHRLEQGRPPFRIGIGVNTGEMAIGNLGSYQRLEYTALGDCVNTAKRLSDLSKETPFYSIFAGEASIQEMSDQTVSWQIDALGEIYVKGKQLPVTTYAITPDESRSESFFDLP